MALFIRLVFTLALPSKWDEALGLAAQPFSAQCEIFPPQAGVAGGKGRTKTWFQCRKDGASTLVRAGTPQARSVDLLC